MNNIIPARALHTIPGAPLRRHLERLIDDAEKQRYGSELHRRRGEQYAYREALRMFSGPSIHALDNAVWADDCARYASDSDYGNGLRGAYTYLATLLRDYAASDATARAILADLGPDPVTGA